MALLNFLIVGATKSGTTSMYEYLAQHPQIFMPVCKEPHYFSRAPKRIKELLGNVKILFLSGQRILHQTNRTVKYF